MTSKPMLIEPPATLPVTLEDARRFCRIDHTDEDPVLETLIAAATSYCDGYSGILSRALITQMWTQPVASFPVAPETQIRLALIPVQEIAGITYYDGAGVVVVMPPADYAFHTDETGSYVSVAGGSSWPSTAVRDDAAHVTYVVGYGDEPQDVPAAVRQAILLMVSAWYDDRTAGVVPPAADRLLSAYRPAIW